MPFTTKLSVNKANPRTGAVATVAAPFHCQISIRPNGEVLLGMKFHFYADETLAADPNAEPIGQANVELTENDLNPGQVTALEAILGLLMGKATEAGEQLEGASPLPSGGG